MPELIIIITILLTQLCIWNAPYQDGRCASFESCIAIRDGNSVNIIRRGELGR